MSVSDYRAKVYRTPVDPRLDPPHEHDGSYNPWCASSPWWPDDPWLRTSDGFFRTYCCCREGALRFVNWSVVNDPARIRAWAEHYGYRPVIDYLDSLTTRS